MILADTYTKYNKTLGNVLAFNALKFRVIARRVRTCTGWGGGG